MDGNMSMLGHVAGFLMAQKPAWPPSEYWMPHSLSSQARHMYPGVRIGQGEPSDALCQSPTAPGRSMPHHASLGELFGPTSHSKHLQPQLLSRVLNALLITSCRTARREHRTMGEITRQVFWARLRLW